MDSISPFAVPGAGSIHYCPCSVWVDPNAGFFVGVNQRRLPLENAGHAHTPVQPGHAVPHRTDEEDRPLTA
jgi:hypothetical protein